MDGQEKIKELENKKDRENLIPKTEISEYDFERNIENKTNHLIKSSKWISVCCDINWLNKIQPKIYSNILETIDIYSERSNIQKIDLNYDNNDQNSNKKIDLPLNSQINRVRWWGPINSENKKLIIKNLDKGIEFRNIENNPINFIVSDNHCMFAVEALDGKPNQSQVFFSDDKIYLEHFNNLFERLWIIGHNAVDRIKENNELQEKRGEKEIQKRKGEEHDENNKIIQNKLELKKTDEKLNVQREITEIIHNSEEFAKRMLHMTEKTRQDVMLLLASSNAFNQSLNYGAFDIFNRIVKEKAVDIRILISSPVSPDSEVQLDAEQRRGCHIYLVHHFRWLLMTLQFPLLPELYLGTHTAGLRSVAVDFRHLISVRTQKNWYLSKIARIGCQRVTASTLLRNISLQIFVVILLVQR